MSYIDTFDHELIGYFGGIPVYHPLEAVPETEDRPEDFACDPTQLVIGGGGGEHLGIVIKSPGEAVMHFLEAWLADEHSRLDEAQRSRLKQIVEPWANAPERCFQCPWSKVFNFAGWTTADYVAFHARCTSPAFMRPFNSEHDGLLESWLAISVGEFILLALPELVEPIVSELGSLRDNIGPFLYQNILLAPPGYPPWGRKEQKGTVTWHIAAWQIERKPNPLTVR